MIYLNLTLSNPYQTRFRMSWSRVFTLSKHKFIELEIYRDATIVSFLFSFTTRQSHAGLDVIVGVLGYNARFAINDDRHWDYTEKRYK